MMATNTTYRVHRDESGEDVEYPLVEAFAAFTKASILQSFSAMDSKLTNAAG